MVVLGIDVGREVEDVLGGAARPAARERFGQPPDRRADSAHADRRRHHHRAERAEPRLIEPLPVKARLETSSETVKPMPAHAPAAASTGR